MSGAAGAIGVVVSLGLMIAGLAGTLLPLPVLPGTPLIWLGMLVFGWATGFARVSAGFLAAQAALAALALVVDALAGVLGARRYGASRYGSWGAAVGGVAGLALGGLVGAILGPLLGAIAGELLAGRSAERAWRAGWGTLIGMAVGAAARFAIGLAMVLWFALRAWT